MKINVKGTVIPDVYAWIYDYFEEPYVSPSKIHDALEEAEGEDVDIYINSGGGDVFAGSEIYTAIRDYKGNVRIHVVGVAASAASVIACAAKSDIAPTAQIMVHNVTTFTAGDYHEMDHTSDMLKQANRSIAAAYTSKTKMTEKEALELMDAETWLTASDAVGWGLIDEISENQNANNQTDGEEDDIRMAAAAGRMIPASVIDKMLAKQQELIEHFS